MATIHLTDRKIQSLQAGHHQTDYWDRNLPGFGVRITPRGRKSFVVMYYARGGKRRMTLGPYPILSLAEARQRARAVLHDVVTGNDPQAQKQALRKAESFEQLAAEYMERHAKAKKRSWKEDGRNLERDLLPYWKGRKAREIVRRDVILILDRIVDRGAPIMANRVRALISKIFNFGIGRDIVEYNPTIGVPRPGKERQRDRVLTEGEIRTIWQTLDDLESLDQVMAATFKMRLLTAQRGIEVVTLRWKHIDGDWWTIPADVAKNGLTHRVPLSPQTHSLLDELHPITGGTPWVFASQRRPGTHITAVQKAAERIVRASGVTFVCHDLRRTAASFMTSMGISRLVVSKILNHVESGVTAVYDRHSYDAEKRRALVRWGGRVESMLTGLEQDNVVRIA
ncbi:MAG: integrase arm-type DNA-binding domain-containing protein [Deltaproteobacteria bacterium]|nr:integrase arm-type DNA-binding domain-containing protein [Deltaproteobacteria bacterium]